MSRLSRLLPIFATLVVAALLHQGVSDYAHLGRDTWPLIATARIMSFSDFLDLFRQELMEGLYPDGDFYRPLTSLTYGLDFAVYGESPRGYHVTDLLLFGLCLASLVSLAGLQVKGRAGVLFATLCGVLFALHPAVRDVLPLTARRADLLCLTALLGALLCSLGSARKPRLAALLCLLACASKETGFLAPLFVLGAAWTVTPRPKLALRFAGPSFAVALVFFGARALVLSGLGGHGDGLKSLAQAPSAFLQTVTAAWMPRSAHLPEALRTPGTLALLALCLAALLSAKQRPPKLLLLGAIAASAALPASSGRFEAWYAFLPAAFTALLFGRLARDAFGGVEEKRWAIALQLSPLLLWIPAVLVGSPLFESENPWLRATQAAERFEARLDASLDAAPAGFEFPLPMPHAIFSARDEDERPLRTVPLYAPYSLAGRELLRLRKAPVSFRSEGEERAGHAGDIHVVLQPHARLVRD